MARPRLHATEEDRRAALRAAWQKYNKAHKQERAAHNKTYVQREEVKARRRCMNRQRALQACMHACIERPEGQNDETAR
jgi:hypothetical protein